MCPCYDLGCVCVCMRALGFVCMLLCLWQTSAGELQTRPDILARSKFTSRLSPYPRLSPGSFTPIIPGVCHMYTRNLTHAHMQACNQLKEASKNVIRYLYSHDFKYQKPLQICDVVCYIVYNADNATNHTQTYTHIHCVNTWAKNPAECVNNMYIICGKCWVTADDTGMNMCNIWVTQILWFESSNAHLRATSDKNCDKTPVSDNKVHISIQIIWDKRHQWAIYIDMRKVGMHIQLAIIQLQPLVSQIIHCLRLFEDILWSFQ